jgi:hypothetical protein
VLSFLLRFEQSGFEPLDVTDNGAGDADDTPGVIVVPSGSTYGTFTLLDNVIAKSKPAVGNENEADLTLDQVFVGSATGGILLVTLADTDFTFPETTTTLSSHLDPFPPNALVGPAGSSISFQSWANADNLSPLPGQPTTIPPGSVTPGPLGPFEPGDPSGSASTSFTRGTGPYSVFCQMTVVLTGEGASCFIGHTHVTGAPIPPSDHPPEVHEGRMTGGGSIFTPDGVRVTHGFELHCNPAIQPNNLQVNIHNPQRDRFHLENLISVQCSDDPTIEPDPPAAPIDTYHALGMGRLNGVSGYTIHFTFTDAGEPGRDDLAEYEIWLDSNSNGLIDSGEEVVLDVGLTPLTFGNHQAHAENKSPTPTQGTWEAHSNARDFPDYWPATGLTPNQRVKSAFSRAGSAPYTSLGNDKLVSALGYPGGTDLLAAARNLLRAGTAALLDASHPNVSYALTANEVRSQVNAALASQDGATIMQLANSLTLPDALRHWRIPTEGGSVSSANSSDKQAFLVSSSQSGDEASGGSIQTSSDTNEELLVVGAPQASTLGSGQPLAALFATPAADRREAGAELVRHADRGSSDALEDDALDQFFATLDEAN